jgi:hypothetical protein
MTDQIIRFINTELKIDITKKKKTNEYVFARIIYYKLATELTNYSLSEIASAVNKDHCAVIHNLKNFQEVIKRPKLKKIYDTFKEYPLEEDRTTYTQVVKLNEQLRLELIETKQKYNQLLKDYTQRDISKIEELLEGLTEQELENVYIKLEAIVKMTKAVR